MERAIKILTAAGSMIGTVLGIYNFLHSRHKEKEELRDNDADRQKYIALRAAMKQSNAESFFSDDGDAAEQQWPNEWLQKDFLSAEWRAIMYCRTANKISFAAPSETQSIGD